MLVRVTLALLLLIAILPLSCLTILGATKSSLQRACVTLVGPLALVGLVTLPWWFSFLGVDVSGLGIILWGGGVGATIGALAPSWTKFMDDTRQLLRWGSTSGLFGTRQNAKGTFEWAYMLIFFTLARPSVTVRVPIGILIVPLGALIGLGACLLIH
jgi:hypothetical protein